MLLKDYLESEANFYSPSPNSRQTSTSGVNDAEANQLAPEWTPMVARHDPRLVDTLIEVLNDCIGDTPVPAPLAGIFELSYGLGKVVWKKNEQEADASNMLISGALQLAALCSEELIEPFELSYQMSARGFSSKVDFVPQDSENRRVVIEAKSPGVFSIAENACSRGRNAFRLDLLAQRPGVAQRVINKMCLYMAAHQSEWGALTCHDKWVFIRLHKATDGLPAYIMFSTVEHQSSNTRPFRALMGMMFATKRNIDVRSGADLTAQLETMEEAEDEIGGTPSPPSSLGHSDEDYTYDGSSGESSQGEGSQLPVLRPRTQTRSAPPDILLGWSQEVTSSNNWLNLYSVYSAEGSLSIGCKPVRLRLERLIGVGSTGSVYEAKLDEPGQHSQSYAIKIVKKGRGEEARGRLAELRQEFDIYRMIEKARSEGWRVHATPRCFGLYETEFTMSLVMEYVGEPLPGLEWRGLKRVEKLKLFTAVCELHAIGICHEDLAPRNIVRSSDGTLRIIDLARGTLHQCPGIRFNGVSSFPVDGKGKDGKCGELESMWRILGKPLLSQRPSKGPGWFETYTQVRPLGDKSTMGDASLAPHGPSCLRV